MRTSTICHRTTVLLGIITSTAVSQTGPTVSHSSDKTSVTNAECGDAEMIVGEGIYAFDNGGPLAADPPRDGCANEASDQFLNDVWFCWTALNDGTATVDMAGLTSIDTIMAVYQGCNCPTSSSTLLGCNDNTTFSYQPQVTFNVLTGESYLIRIGSSTLGSASAGRGEFRISYAGQRDPLCTRSADQCQLPDTVNALRSTRGESVVADDFTPEADGDIAEVCWWGTYLQDDISQCASVNADDFEVRYYADDDGAPGALVGGPFSQSAGTLQVVGPARTSQPIDETHASYQYTGTHAAVSVSVNSCYWIEISNTQTMSRTWMWQTSAIYNRRSMQDGSDDAPANGFDHSDLGNEDLAFCFDLPLSHSVSCVEEPVNDYCADAMVVSDGDFPINTSAATSDGPTGSYPYYVPFGFLLGDEAIHNDIWFDYTATCDGRLIVDFCDATFDSKLALYDATDCSSFELLTGNDDACGSEAGLQSQASLDVVTGQKIKIQVGGTRVHPPLEETQCRSAPNRYSAPGCPDPRCEAIVCSLDQDCCSKIWSWYPVCVNLARQNCPGSCHIANDSTGCIDPFCQSQICALRPSCCDLPDNQGEWDLTCASMARDLCTGATGTGTLRIRCVDPPARDRCADVQIESLPFSFLGDNFDATHECDLVPGNHTWLAFELCDAADVTLQYHSGTSTGLADAWLRLVKGCPCEDLTKEGRMVRATNGDPRVSWDCLPPGTYYYPILSAPGSDGPYLISGVSSPCAGLCSNGSGDCCAAHIDTGCGEVDCCKTVCALDSYCCDVQWDELCVREAGTACPAWFWGPCDFAVGDCFEVKDTPGCNDRSLCEAVCSCDPYCCEVEWDSFCAGEGMHAGCGAAADCDGNGIVDAVDIISGTSEDCDQNGVPDICEPDCNGNLVADTCDISGCASTDCNENGTPDECDISSGLADDCNGDSVIDRCEGRLVGDFDDDEDSDLEDLAAAQRCFSGSGIHILRPCCSIFDGATDRNIDLADFAQAAASLTGPS